MNITFVSDAIYPYNKGGKEKRLYELSTRLAQLGYDVHIYTMHWWVSPEKTRTEDGVQLHAISKLYRMYSGDRRSIKEGILFGLACFKLLTVKFEILDVDHMPFFPIYSTWIVCILRHKKLYGTWHETLDRHEWVQYMGIAGHAAYIIQNVSIKLPHRITSSSVHTMESLRDQHKSKVVTAVTPGIDTKALHKLVAAKIKCDVLYTGRLVKDKNVDKLVRAIDLLRKDNSSIQCMIIGHGIEKTNIEKLIKKLKLENNIHILEPFPNDSDVYAYMKASKVFCLPSAREGFGMVVLESIGCGTPVVTINTPSNNSRYLVQNGQNGSLVSLTSSSLAHGIKIWINKQKPKRISSQLGHYEWDYLAKAQAEVYLT